MGGFFYNQMINQIVLMVANASFNFTIHSNSAVSTHSI